MIFFSLKVKGNERKGISLKKLVDDQCSDESLNEFGICKICKAKPAPADLVKCMACDQTFHNMCLNFPPPSDFQKALAKNPCCWWFCATCSTTSTADKPPAKESGDNDSEQVDLKTLISDQFSSLKNSLRQEVDDIVSQKLGSLFGQNNTSEVSESDQLDSGMGVSPVTSYADLFSSGSSHQFPSLQVAQTPSLSQPASPEILVLSTCDDSSEVSAVKLNQVKSSVEGKLKNTQVEFVRVNAKNKTVKIGFRNQKMRDEGNAIISEDDHLSSLGFKSKAANKLLPKITVTGIPTFILDDHGIEGDDEDSEVREAQKGLVISMIKDKNPAVAKLAGEGHTLSVVFISKIIERYGREERTLALKISPAIRSAILMQQGGKLYLGSSSYPIKDRHHFKQCYHCQNVGHTSHDCPDVKEKKPSTCMYCMDAHRSKDCPKKTDIVSHCCARCKKSANPSDNRTYTSHHAGSPICPILIRETRRLIDITDTVSKNVM